MASRNSQATSVMNAGLGLTGLPLAALAASALMPSTICPMSSGLSRTNSSASTPATPEQAAITHQASRQSPVCLMSSSSSLAEMPPAMAPAEYMIDSAIARRRRNQRATAVCDGNDAPVHTPPPTRMPNAMYAPSAESTTAAMATAPATSITVPMTMVVRDPSLFTSRATRGPGRPDMMM